jgi:D-arabinose 5-phosphate isomerase GutQ
VPVHSQSDRALVANLGNLEVHNSFKVVQGGVGRDIAVVDNMAVSFTSLQLSVYVILSCNVCSRIAVQIVNKVIFQFRS